MTSGALMSYGNTQYQPKYRGTQVRLAFFFNSTLLNVKVFAMTVKATKSLYGSNSVAVNVERASRRSSPPRLNWRIETRYKPLYTLRRFRLSQSPPSSISLKQTCCKEGNVG